MFQITFSQENFYMNLIREYLETANILAQMEEEDFEMYLITL